MIPKIHKGYETFYAPDRGAWRRWLEANYASSKGVWLVYYKKGSDKPRVSYNEAVEEALCFGWIDSRPNKIDDERYMQLFTPRKAGSVWAKSNKERVERLIEQGLMTPAGLEKVEVAKRNGRWEALTDAEELVMPEDLKRSLMASPDALKNFEAFRLTEKKRLLYWIGNVKRPEARAKRIEETTLIAAKNMRLNDYLREKMNAGRPTGES